eukprot:gene9506-1712_t
MKKTETQEEKNEIIEPLKEKYKKYKINNENNIFNITNEEEVLMTILKTETSTKIEIENSKQEFYQKAEENALQLLMKKTENFDEEEFEKLSYEQQIQYITKLLNEKTF